MNQSKSVLISVCKFFLYLVPFSAVIVSRSTLFPFIVGKYVFFRTTVALAAIFFIWHWAFQTRTNADHKQTNTDIKNKKELLYEDLTYKIRGIIFDVKRQLGLGHKEIIYQNALEAEFKKNNIFFEKEKSIDIMYDNKKIGVYRPDFIIENKVVLELKSIPFLGKNEKKQIWYYLKGSNYKLALLVNFGRKDIEIERFINDYERTHTDHEQTNTDSARTNSGPYKSVFSPHGSVLSQYGSVLSPLKSALIIFALIFIISGFFGYNPVFSFWSNFERGEGGLQMIFLLIYFLLLTVVFKDKESWRRMLIAASWAAALVIAYGLGAILGIKAFVGDGLCARFAGSLGNSAYLGTYMLFAIFYAAYLAMARTNTDYKQTNTDSRYKSVLSRYKSVFFWLGLLVVFAVFLLLSQTRGAFLGLGAAIIFGLFYLFFNSSISKKIRWVSLSLAVILIISGSLAVKFRNSMNLSLPFCGEGGMRILDVSLNTQNFQTRLWLWQQSIISFKEKPVFGWGMENFNVPFEKHYDPRFEVWYDRAHNIFFDYLTMTGILGLLSFVGIFIVYYWQFFKTQTNTDYTQTNADSSHKSVPYQHKSALDPYQSALIFALPIAYLVQGLVLFDVLPIYINLFLFLAFASYKFNKLN